jgi:hypothetical protein
MSVAVLEFERLPTAERTDVVVVSSNRPATTNPSDYQDDRIQLE